MKENIILIGGGGHCKSVIDVIELEDKFNIIGIIDQENMLGKDLLGYNIIGTDTDIDTLIKKCNNFHITIGHIKSNEARVKYFELIKSKGGIFPILKSPDSYVSKYATIHEGSIVMHNAFVNANAVIGKNCIINNGAVIEHDVVIEDNCHISTGAFINGGCVIKKNCFIGSNATLVQGISIAENNLIGAGSVVTKNTDANFIYAGNPARKIKKK